MGTQNQDSLPNNFAKTLNVATYKTLADMPEHLRKVLPDAKEMCKLLR